VKSYEWLLLAAVGLVLLWLVRRRQIVPGQAAQAPGPTGTVNDAPVGQSGGGKSDPRFTGTGGSFGTGTGRDVAPADLGYPPWANGSPIDPSTKTTERDIFTMDEVTADFVDTWRQILNRQVIAPAALLTAADLTQEVVDLAQRLLDGTLTPQTERDEMSDHQKQQADLNASDSTADELYEVWKTIANIAGSFTFGLTALAANLVDQYAGTDGKSVTNELNAAGVANKLVQGSLSGTDFVGLMKWLGPVALIGGRNPGTDWTPDTLAAAFSYLTSKSLTPPKSPLLPIDHAVSPSGVVPVFHRAQLFMIGRGGYYLRWNAVELTQGLSFRERVNLRARIYRALDVIACQLFPYTEPQITPAGSPPVEPAGLYAYYNKFYRGADGKGSGWMKGSVFPPIAGDSITWQGIQAFKAAATTALTPPPPPAATTVLTPGTVGNPLSGNHGGFTFGFGTIGHP
jgi:hypothetical protein